MGTTSKLGIPYPSEGQDVWYESFVAMVNAFDSVLYAAKEDPYLILNGLEDIRLDVQADAMVIDHDIEILSTLTGGSLVIRAASISGMVSGKIAVVELSRPVTGAREVTVQLVDTMSANQNYFFIGLRRGDDLILRGQSKFGPDAMVVNRVSGSGKITTPSISAGSLYRGSIQLSIVDGIVMMASVRALSATGDTDILFGNVSLMSDPLNIAHEVDGVDCSTSVYRSGVWYTLSLTSGVLYYEIRNNGLVASIYEIEVVSMGEMIS